jgi:hypothetical protein
MVIDNDDLNVSDILSLRENARDESVEVLLFLVSGQHEAEL